VIASPADAEVQHAIDRYISRNPAGATDLSEIAQQSTSEEFQMPVERRGATRYNFGAIAEVSQLRPPIKTCHPRRVSL
jgi:hypothetical protein